MTHEREVLKGTREKIVVMPWQMTYSKTGVTRDFVSVGIQELVVDEDTGRSEYHRRRGGFAVSPSEARELATYLVEMADVVDSIIEAREVGE